MESVDAIVEARLVEHAINGDVGAAEMLGFVLDDAAVAEFALSLGMGVFAEMNADGKREARLIALCEQALGSLGGTDDDQLAR